MRSRRRTLARGLGPGGEGTGPRAPTTDGISSFRGSLEAVQGECYVLTATHLHMIPAQSSKGDAKSSSGMVRLTDILDKVKGYHAAADTDLINKAYVFSAGAHEGQLRKSGDPYFIHPVSVAEIIAEMRLDTASVCAALLHDTVEDTGATTEEISRSLR